MNNKIILITGFSAAGKDTVMNYITEEYPEYTGVVSTTSRPPRPNEVEGVDYHFVSESEFLRKLKDKEMLEYREYNTLLNNVPATWFYGTATDSIEDTKPYVLVLDIDGVSSIVEKYGERCIVIFISAYEETRRERAEDRGGFSLTEWLRRCADDEKKFPADVVENITDYFISNERSKGGLWLEAMSVMEEIENE